MHIDHPLIQGMLAHFAPLLNSFCSTGKGGGVDPSCGGSGGGGAHATPDETYAEVKGTLENMPKGERIRIKDLRAQIDSSHSHGNVTEALWRLANEGKLSMYRLDDPREITQKDRDAAVRTGSGEEKHILYYGGQGS